MWNFSGKQNDRDMPVSRTGKYFATRHMHVPSNAKPGPVDSIAPKTQLPNQKPNTRLPLCASSGAMGGLRNVATGIESGAINARDPLLIRTERSAPPSAKVWALRL